MRSPCCIEQSQSKTWLSSNRIKTVLPYLAQRRSASKTWLSSNRIKTYGSCLPDRVGRSKTWLSSNRIKTHLQSDVFEQICSPKLGYPVTGLRRIGFTYLLCNSLCPKLGYPVTGLRRRHFQATPGEPPVQNLAIQ